MNLLHISAHSGAGTASAPQREAERTSRIGIGVDLALTAFKLLAGIVAHSGAMVSDAVHSASDAFSSVIVILGVRAAAKDSDREHPYGHERFECVAAIVLSLILAVTGFSIGLNAVKAIAAGPAENAAAPGILALVAAGVSVLVKEGMFWFTRSVARRIGSTALMAGAWHHRSDALSSVGALLGILGARLGFAAADALASLVICVFIEKAALDIFRDAVGRMVDQACDAETEEAIRRRALDIEGVKSVDLLQTRTFGSRIYVEMEIGADGSMTLFDAHRIAETVHDSIETAFPQVKHIMIHVNPIGDEADGA